MDDNSIYTAIDNLFRELRLSHDRRTAERIHRTLISAQTLHQAGFKPVYYKRNKAVGAINQRFLPPTERNDG